MSSSMGVVKAISTRLWPRSLVGCPSSTFTIVPNVCLILTTTSVLHTCGERQASRERSRRLLESSYHEGFARFVLRLWKTVRICQGKFRQTTLAYRPRSDKRRAAAGNRAEGQLCRTSALMV